MGMHTCLFWAEGATAEDAEFDFSDLLDLKKLKPDTWGKVRNRVHSRACGHKKRQLLRLGISKMTASKMAGEFGKEIATSWEKNVRT